MKVALKTVCLAACLWPSLPMLAGTAQPLINHVDYRFVCVKDKVRLEVKATAQDWLRPSNACGDEECRVEPACNSERGRQLLQDPAHFDTIALDLACYSGRLYHRHIDAKGYFKIQRYKGKPPTVCKPADNSHFTAAYFMSFDELGEHHVNEQK